VTDALPTGDRTDSKFFIGPSGWSYADWAGVVYPPRRPRGFHALTFLADYFDAVEVNVSFYRLVSPSMAEGWVRRVGKQPRFRFTFKLHQSFTHERDEYSTRSVADFLAGVAPVADAGRLGCVLAQFPWSFRRTEANVDWLRRLAADFAQHPLVAELRHDSWDVPETLELFKSLAVGYCNIDQPPLGHCLGPSGRATSRVGYVRFHGRRADTWFAQKIPPFERYNYLYSPEELSSWVPRIRRVGEHTEQVYVFANNHYRGQGPANALQLRGLLEDGPVPVPPTMVETFPDLKIITSPPSDEFPELLF